MIEIKKPFKVIIMTPHYPIGDVIKGYDTREIIIKLQFETKRMMFKKLTDFINEKIKLYENDKDLYKYYSKLCPDDYLVFLTIVKTIDINKMNYEKKLGDSLKIIEKNDGIDDLINFLNKNNKENIRSISKQIYVHLKLMIIDDSFLIVGSANINDRSMLPNGDTEICISLYSKSILNFRKKLFKIHFGEELGDFDKINNDEFWKLFNERGIVNYDGYYTKKKEIPYGNFIIFERNDNYNGDLDEVEIKIGQKISSNYGRDYKIVKYLPIQLLM
jgi:phosphatidylserine/phosphatidylglycerophosphate/cardiolipin synthase-like enzyme